MLDDDIIRALAEAGASAPTGGNTQPWRVRATRETLEISLDETRSGAFIDVDRSSSLLGIGSFVENVAVAARARGLEPTVEILGLTSIDEPVARISFEPVDRIDETAMIALRERATNRRPWNGETIDRERIERVAAAAAADGEHRLLTVSGDARSQVADALAEADVVRTFNRAYLEGMQSEFRWTPEEAETTRDGIDLATLELSEGDRRGLAMMRRRWFVSLFVTRKRIRGMGRKALLGSSHLAAVVMPGEADPRQLVAAGRAVQRTWLAATQAGLAIQPWCTIPFFHLRAERYPESLPERDVRTIEEIMAALRSAWSAGADERVIFTFRMSTPDGPPSAFALRRPWTDFTTIDRE
jgi:nitroreductase